MKWGLAREKQQVVLGTGHHYQRGSKVSEVLEDCCSHSWLDIESHGYFKNFDADCQSHLFCNNPNPSNASK